MATDVAVWCRDCQLCARGKASPQHTAPFQSIPIPERRFTHVHVDLVGPPPHIDGGVQVLVHHGGHVVQVAGGDPFADHGGRGLCGRPHLILGGKVCGANHHHFRPGPPVHLLSVGRPLTKLLGIKQVQTTAYHPQSNGMVERTHGQLKAAVRGAASGLEIARALAMGVTGPARSPERRQRRLGGRAGVRCGVGAASGIFVHSGAVGRRFPAGRDSSHQTPLLR
jgi:hypothetical protein